MKLNHIDLPVTDIAGARSFFERLFGFHCILSRRDGLTVLLDEADFALTLSPLPQGESLRYPSGFHVGFNLPDEASFNDAYTRLIDAGIVIVREKSLLGGAPTFQCEAPGPLIVEFAWRPAD